MLEVGPGPGGLTRALLATDAACVIAVERDARCLAAIAELAEGAAGRLRPVHADALEVDLGALGAARVTIVANLPYNVGTALLLRWLGELDRIEAMVLMFQREVADRLVASPRTAAYGRLSVLAQWLCEVELLMHLPSGAFVPPPRVSSSLVRLVPLPAPRAEADRPALETVLAAAFGQRRKMLRGSLRQIASRPEALLEAAGLDPARRAEEIDVAGFCALARAYAARSKSGF